MGLLTTLGSSTNFGLVLFAVKHIHTISPIKPAPAPMPAICEPLRRGDSGSCSGWLLLVTAAVAPADAVATAPTADAVAVYDGVCVCWFSVPESIYVFVIDKVGVIVIAGTFVEYAVIVS